MRIDRDDVMARSHLIITLGLTGLAVICTLMSSGTAIAQRSAPVRIASPVPLPVRDVDNAARRPFQAELCTQVPLGGSFCGTKPSTFAVPADRRLVIEYASGRCPRSGFSLSNGEDWAASLQTIAGGTQARHLLHPVPGIAIGSPPLQSAMQLNGFDVAQLMRIYADPGSLVGLQFEDLGGLAGNVITCEMTISGYTVAP
jgi:hypothetical protein